ncbi:Fc.00g037430.m01.CDS01 [Cosmosporella sp. VM-42]
MAGFNTERSPQASPSIVGSQFGDGTRVHQGPVNNHYYQKTDDDGNAIFLASFNCLDARVDRLLREDIVQEYPECTFDWVLEDESVSQWYENEELRLLWIQEETGKGHTAVVLTILEFLEQHLTEGTTLQPVIAYFFCGPVDNESRTVSQALQSLIYSLLAKNTSVLTSIRKTWGTILRDAMPEASRSRILSRIIQDIFNHPSFDTCRIYIIVDGLDLLGIHEGNQNVAQIIDLLKPKTQQKSQTKWIISSRFEWSCYKRQYNPMKTILELGPTKLACSFGLSESIELIYKCAAEMEMAYQYFRSKSAESLESLEWFRYSTQGRSWLDKRHLMESAAIFSSVIHYRPQTSEGQKTISGDPTQLSLYVADFVKSAEERDCIVAYFSYESLAPHAFASDPRLALWSIFSQVAYKFSNNKDNLSRALLSLDAHTQSVLGEACSLATMLFDKWNLPKHHEICLDGVKAQMPGLIHEMWTEIAVHLSTERLVVLLKAVLSFDVTTPLLLVFDSLESLKNPDWSSFLVILGDLADFRNLRIFISRGPISNEADSTDIFLVSDSTEYKECLERLKYKGGNTRREQVRNALNGTNQWLWGNEAHRQWQSSGGLFWISGKAGSGKSVLAKTIVQKWCTISKKGEKRTRQFFDWFYDRRGHEHGRSHLYMLQSMLHSILSKDRTAFGTVRARYRIVMDDAFRYLHFSGWHFECLLDMLRSLALSPSTPETLAILDGLDESEAGNTRWQLLDSLLEITSTQGARLQVIILSRPEPEILKRLHNCLHIVMQDHNRGDIEQLADSQMNAIRCAWMGESLSFSSTREDEVVSENAFSNPRTELETLHQPNSRKSTPKQSSVCQLPGSEEAELERIRTYLLKYAEGVILWVRLVLQQLRICVENKAGFSITDLRKRALDLPKELYDFYVYTLRSAGVLEDPGKSAITRRILLWVMGTRSSEPLQLRDLHDALAIPEANELSSSSTEDQIALGRFQILKNWSRFCDIIYSHCGPLVEVIENRTNAEIQGTWRVEKVQPTWTIHLLHQTVKSFLEDSSISGEFCIQESQAKSFVLDESYRFIRIVVPEIETAYTPKVSSLDLKRLTDGQFQQDKNTQSSWVLWFDYFNDRPFLRYALKAIGKVKRGQIWVESLPTSFQPDGPICDERFPFWWAFDNYHGCRLGERPNYVRQFAKSAFQQGEPFAFEIFISFMALIDANYCKDRDINAHSKSKRRESLLWGLMDALLSTESCPACAFRTEANIIDEVGIELDWSWPTIPWDSDAYWDVFEQSLKDRKGLVDEHQTSSAITSSTCTKCNETKVCKLHSGHGNSNIGEMSMSSAREHIMARTILAYTRTLRPDHRRIARGGRWEWLRRRWLSPPILFTV